MASTALAAVLMLLLVGDRAAYTAIAGIDPLDVLDLAIKNNVLFIVDTSSSMSGLTISPNNKDVGGDDLAGRFYQVKRAVREVVAQNEGIVNFGLGTFHPEFDEHELASTSSSEGPLQYVSQDAAAANWMLFFNTPSSTYTAYDDTTSIEVFRSFDSNTLGFGTPYPSAATCTNAASAGADHIFNTTCRYYIRSLRLRNGVRYTWTKASGNAGLTATANITCPLPPKGLVGDDTEPANGGPGADGTFGTPDDVAAKPRACFEIQAGAGGPVARYFYASSTFKFINVPDSKPIVSSTAGTPGVVNAPFHGLSTGTAVLISGHTGSTPSINGTRTVTVIDPDNFTIGVNITVGGTGGSFSIDNDPASCAQSGINVTVSPCDGDNAQTIKDLMRLELQVDAAGVPIDVPTNSSLHKIKPYNPPGVTNSFVMTGIRQGNGTPLGASLEWAKTYFVGQIFPIQPPAIVAKQKHFVILLTDGGESCSGDPVAAAQALWNLTPSVETFVVAFVGGTGASANAIACAGSGGGATCRKAYTALTLAELIQSLNDALSIASTSGTYSAQPTVTQSIFELGSVLPTPVDPLDPKTRYNANVPVLFASTFEMPGFKGHVKAFRNASGTPLEVWGAGQDAGQKLLDRVKSGMEVGPSPTACPSKTVDSVSYKACTFAELLNGATEATVSTASRIKRRIYTTTGNNLAPVTVTMLIDRTANVSAGATAYRVPLWPPTTATSGGVAPNDANNSPGILDGALGLLSLTEQQLKDRFQACVGSNRPTDCTVTTGPGGGAPKRLAEHRREAREMMLAFLAGAQTIPDGNREPARDGTAKRLLFKARPWILAEGTISTPGVVTPPPQSVPTIHAEEYKHLRDGPRDAANLATNGILEGFGLRNPDNDGQATSASSPTLKPAMSVVYHGANDGLHAFRAAPCASASLPCAGETGGEELWAFVPFDQLGKLASLMKPQRRSTKTYMIASPVRFAAVFVPAPGGSFTKAFGAATVAGAGVWRTLLYVGRGIGGKYLTALDVTVPGPFTRHSLTGDGTNGGEKYAPLPVWSRGNPDTSDGQLKGVGNVYNNDHATAGATDYTAYLRMGQTWSVPAIAAVTAAENTTLRTPGGVEFAAYVGSGYGASAPILEGTTFYALDALTGDVIASTDVGSATTSPPDFTPNALVASPAVFNPIAFKWKYLGNPAGEKATRVYIGDVYGRLWKFLPSTAKASPPFPAILMQDLGVQQTIGAAVALINLDYDLTGGKPYIFLETGRDNRVRPPPAATPPFKLVGLRDDAPDGDATMPPATPAFKLFEIDLPGPPDPVNLRFRGTSQPATAFNEKGMGRVFFVGTQFNPIDVNCISSFDSILFGLTAGTGEVAYDMGGPTPAYTTFIGDKITGVQVVDGQLVLSQAIGGVPVPPPPPTPLPPGPGTDADVFLGSKLPGSTAYRVGSVVCQP